MRIAHMQSLRLILFSTPIVATNIRRLQVMKSSCVRCGKQFKNNVSLGKHAKTCKKKWRTSKSPSTRSSSQETETIRGHKRARVARPNEDDEEQPGPSTSNTHGVCLLYIRNTIDNFHRTHRLWEEVHRDRHHPHLYCQSARDAQYEYRATSKITSLMATCLSLTYHPVYPHRLSAMIARQLRRSSKGLFRIYDHTHSRLAQTNLAYFDDTRVRQHGSQSTKRD